MAKSPEKSGGILQRFAANCRKLQIDPDIWHRAIKTFHRLNVDGYLSSEADEWLTCSIYSELQKKKLIDMREGGGDKDKDKNDSDLVENEPEKKQIYRNWNTSLTHLLFVFKINVKKFLQRMEYWNWLVQSPPIFQQDFNGIELCLGITCHLAYKYKKIFQQLFVYPKSTQSQSYYHMVLEFGWVLFLTIRNELPQIVTESVVNGCQALICVIEVVYMNALEASNWDIMNTNFDGFPKKSERGIPAAEISGMNAILKLLPELPQKSTNIMRSSVFNKAIMTLFSDQRLLGNDRLHRDLIRDDMLEVNLSNLSRSYSQHVADISEVDERVFLKYNPYLETGGEKLLQSISIRQEDDQQHSSGMNHLLSLDLPQTLPSSLAKAISKDDLKMMDNKLEQMISKVEKAAHLDDESKECRSKLTRGLYHTLLERIVSDELHVRPTMNLNQLMNQPQCSFNTALITCCLQLVLHVHSAQQPRQQFPWILKCLDIDPYEFQKIIELVARNENGLLTGDLINHLREVEAKCLLSLIWQKKSQLWDFSLPSCHQAQRGNSSQPSAVGICHRKFYCLAGQRLTQLCQQLDLLDSYKQLWHIMEHSLVACGQKLLQQRHLDQLVICAVHLYTSKFESASRLSFNKILQFYRLLPYATSDVYRRVHMAEDQPTVDIICFYNTLYVPHMLDFVQRASFTCTSRQVERDSINVSGSVMYNGGRDIRVLVSNASLPRRCTNVNCKARLYTATANLKRSSSHNKLPQENLSKRSVKGQPLLNKTG